MDTQELKHIIEAAVLAAPQPLSLAQLGAVFGEEHAPSRNELLQAIEQLRNDTLERGVELVEVASGYRYQVREQTHPWVARLWTERPPRYSRALLETLALIAYRQPATRGEIEQVRGVGVSSGIIRTLEEREWIRVVGYRDVPGKPALFGTTKLFLDYFNLKSLDELPSLAEVRDLEAFDPQLNFDDGVPQQNAPDTVGASDGNDADAEQPAADQDAGDTDNLDAEIDLEQIESDHPDAMSGETQA